MAWPYLDRNISIGIQSLKDQFRASELSLHLGIHLKENSIHWRLLRAWKWWRKWTLGPRCLGPIPHSPCDCGEVTTSVLSLFFCKMRILIVTSIVIIVIYSLWPHGPRRMQGSSAAAAKSLQSCPTLQSHRGQPTRLPHPWDSPGKNTGVGCHFLLQCIKVKSESEVAQLCPTLRDPMDCSLPGASIRGIAQARFLCPPLSPGVCSNACPLSQWYYLTILSSVIPFSSHLQSFPASGSFPMSQLFSSGGQNIRASASVLPMKIQDRFPLWLTGLISLQSKGLWRIFPSTQFEGVNSLAISLL